jgi:hypothetical protein
MFADIYLWFGFLAFVFLMLALDLGVFHRKSHEVKIREALIWSAVWISPLPRDYIAWSYKSYFNFFLFGQNGKDISNTFLFSSFIHPMTLSHREKYGSPPCNLLFAARHLLFPKHTCLVDNILLYLKA